MTTMTLKIEGMGCSGCVNTVEQAILNVEHVDSVNVDLESEIAKVIYRDDEPEMDLLKKAVDEAGYSASEA